MESNKTFKEWIAERYPSLNDKVEACYKELVDGANVVDIDFAGCSLSPGKLRHKDIAVNSADSKGRCRVYFNIKDYNGDQFPHFVFQNFRASYSDPSSGKAIPSVVNTVGILFEQYQSGSPLRKNSYKAAIHKAKPAVNRMTLVNEQRRWFSKLFKYGEKGRESMYFHKKGIMKEWILDDPLLDFRLGYSRRYGQYCALPFRYLHQDTFMGFQRIYDTGEKIMMKEFDPSGLCFYFPSDELAIEPLTLKTVILQEGGANAFLAHFMSKQLGLKALANVGGLYADNLPVLAEILATELPSVERILLIYDNDDNHKGQTIANRCKEICPRIHIDTFERNDIAAMVSGFNYEYAKKEFALMLKKAFS